MGDAHLHVEASDKGWLTQDQWEAKIRSHDDHDCFIMNCHRQRHVLGVDLGSVGGVATHFTAREDGTLVNNVPISFTLETETVDIPNGNGFMVKHPIGRSLDVTFEPNRLTEQNIADAFGVPLEVIRPKAFISINFDNTPKEETLMDIKKNLQAQIDRASERLAKLEQFGDDTFETGQVLRFDIKFDTRDEPYNYAAIKLDDGRWSVTGSKNPYPLTWSDLVLFWAETSGGEVIYLDAASEHDVILDLRDEES